ncbi:MAG: hypothetical protein H0U49_03380 [Parachlamydiaceae bacterium]|nr:hypothetical protein [Parachlamydiaceae bacterium]
MQETINSELLAGFIDLLHLNAKKAPHSDKEYDKAEIAELYHSAYHFYQNGKYPEAVNFFYALTAMDSINVHYWIGYAASLKMVRQFQKALDAYIIAGMLNYQDPFVHAHAADCCFALGQIDRGLLAIDLAESLGRKIEDNEDFISQLAVIREAWFNHKNNSK